MRRLYTFAFIFNLIWRTAISQTSVSESYTVLSGLPHSNVRAIHLDNKGFLWIGTNDGISRFDGYSFYNYTANNNNLGHLNNDFIFDIDKFTNNKLVFVTGGGLEIFNTKIQQFSHHFDTAIGKKFNQVLFNNIDNSVYVTNGKIIASLNYNNNTPIFNVIAQSDLKSNLGIHSSDSCLWIYYNKTLVKYNVKNSVGKKLSELTHYQSPNLIQSITNLNDTIIAIFSYPEITFLHQYNLSVLKVIKPELKYFSNSKGLKTSAVNQNQLIVYDHKNVCRVNTINAGSELIYKANNADEVINTCKVDNSGIIWIGTSHGLLKIIPYKQPITMHNFDEGTFTPGACNTIALKNKHILITSTARLIETNSPKLLKENGISNIHYIKQLPHNANIMLVASNKRLLICEHNTTQEFVHDQLSNRAINYIQYNENDSTLCLATNKGVVIAKIRTFTPPTVRVDKIISDSTAFSKVVKSQGDFFAIDNKRLFKIQQNSDPLHIYQFPDNISQVNDIAIDSNLRVWLATSQGIYYKDKNEHQIRRLSVFLRKINAYSLIVDNQNNLWSATSKGIIRIPKENNEVNWYNNSDGVPNNAFNPAAAAKLSDGTLLFGSRDGILSVTPENIHVNQHACPVQFIECLNYEAKENISIPLVNSDTLKIVPNINNSEIIFSALDYYAPQYNTYEYSIYQKNKLNTYHYLGYQNSIIISHLPAGVYQLRVRGRNNHGTPSQNEAILHLEIQAPIWKSKLAMLIYIGLIVLLFYLVVMARTKQLRKSNRAFKERERIARKIRLQKEELTLKNKSITDSINYARRIQMAMMPSLRIFKQHFPESFILYIPKDIVSGDFYWINEVNNRIFFSAVDCTGHGVPGAFMSIIGFELFRRITETDKILKPAEILNQLSSNIQDLFSDDEEAPLHDGMDLAFCAIDKKYKKLEFSGAFNPLYLIRNNSITEYKGNRFSVGWNGEDEEQKGFDNHVIDLEPGDVIYIFTDGYADQFGGPEGKKYKYRRFRHLLLALHQLSPNRQEEFLRKSIMEWKGDHDQVDDILVIGIKIPPV